MQEENYKPKTILTPIKDLALVLNKVVTDERGSLCEQSSGGIDSNPFFQDGIKHLYTSIATERLTPRGGHYHHQLKENFYTLSGTAIWYFYDFRKNSPTFQKEYAMVVGYHQSEKDFGLPVFTIDQNSMTQIFIPTGVYHLFWPISNEKVVVSGVCSLPHDSDDYVRLMPEEIPGNNPILNKVQNIIEDLKKETSTDSAIIQNNPAKTKSLPNIKAVIAAGRSIQTRPLTHPINKHLIPLANKPMIFYSIEHLAKTGFKEIAIVISPGEKELQEVVGDGSRWNIKIEYLPQQKSGLGLGYVIKTAKDYTKESPFLLYLGDNIIKTDLNNLIDQFFQQKHNCLLCLSKSKKIQEFGVPEIREGRIVKIEERPMEPKSDYAIAGLYLYDQNVHQAFDNIKPSFRGDYEIQDIHNWLIQNNFNLGWQEIESWWKDRGRSEDILEGNQIALAMINPKVQGMVESSVNIQGKVEIGQGSKILGNTTLCGPISIGESSLIKDSYIGPYTSIGNQVEIHNAEIESSLIMDYSCINTKTRIVDSMFGKNSTIISTEHSCRSGNKIIIGENSLVSL